MPRKSTRALKEIGAKFEPGPYKFKVINVTDEPKYDSWKVELQTWTESNEDGPKVSDFLQHSNYEEEWMEDEPNRVFQVMCGSLDIDMKDLMGKSGFVVLSWDKKGYLSPNPKGAYFTQDRKDAFGEETMSTAIEYALSVERVKPNAQEDVQKHEGSSL